MKKSIHPKYGKTSVKCACGAVFEVYSTKENLEVELCSLCHPFYTGKQKFVDTQGRVDKFEERRRKAEALRKKEAERINKKAKEELEKPTDENIEEIREELEENIVDTETEKEEKELSNKNIDTKKESK